MSENTFMGVPREKIDWCPTIDYSKCNYCMECVKFCPHHVFETVEDYEAFQQDARDMGLSEDYTITSTDVENYENSLIPLENLSKFATYFFWVVLLIGGIILVVFNLFHIREQAMK